MFKELLQKIFSLRNVIAAGVIFLACILVVIFIDKLVMPWYTKHGEALAVPNVVAKRYEMAKELLEIQGLEVVKEGEKYDSRLPFGYVVDQNPRANRLVKKGRRVYLTISVGEREIQVPNLKGLSETNAEETLKSLGLRVGKREYKYIAEELPQVVIEQSVPAKSFIKASSAVDITVSLGEPVANVVVPSVFGISLEAAKREIQKSGLTIGVITYRRNPEMLPNSVLEQSLEAGTTVANGDTVNLVVSRLY